MPCARKSPGSINEVAELRNPLLMAALLLYVGMFLADPKN